MPDFELFTRPATRRGQMAAVTILSTGNFSLSSAAFAVLGSPEALRFLWAPRQRCIGFEPAGPGAADAYAVSGPGHKIAARAFLRFAGIDWSESRSWPLITGEGPPHIDLSAEGTVVSRRRAS